MDISLGVASGVVLVPNVYEDGTLEQSVSLKAPLGGSVTITASVNIGRAAEKTPNFSASMFSAWVASTFSGKVDLPNVGSHTQKRSQLPKH